MCSRSKGIQEMNWKNFISVMVLTLVIVLGASNGSFASDNVEWNVYKTLQLDATPIDVAVSPDGRRFFVLTERGEVVIYSSSGPSAGKIEARIDVGKHVDQLKLGPKGTSLVLSSSKNKTVQIVTFDFIQEINVSGSPFKGPEDAPVVIAVFDDFQ
jgi:WD40 repeat protein